MFIFRTLVSVMGGLSMGDFATASMSGVARYTMTFFKISLMRSSFSRAGLVSARNGSSVMTSLSTISVSDLRPSPSACFLICRLPR